MMKHLSTEGRAYRIGDPVNVFCQTTAVVTTPQEQATMFAGEVTCMACLRRAVNFYEAKASEVQNTNDDLRASISHLIENAEEITIQSATGTPYKPKMVDASDLFDVLDGRSRY